jgi:hypothetical protein
MASTIRRISSGFIDFSDDRPGVCLAILSTVVELLSSNYCCLRTAAVFELSGQPHDPETIQAIGSAQALLERTRHPNSDPAFGPAEHRHCREMAVPVAWQLQHCRQSRRHRTWAPKHPTVFGKISAIPTASET